MHPCHSQSSICPACEIRTEPARDSPSPPRPEPPREAENGNRTPRGLPQPVKENLSKARDAALAAVEIYNKPAIDFRAGNYIVLMVIAWTAVFHAIFYRRGTRPWYELESTGKRKRYKRIDGDVAHWELAECIRQYFVTSNPPERKNLEFILGLRRSSPAACHTSIRHYSVN